jgi:hypothetical protein
MRAIVTDDNYHTNMTEPVHRLSPAPGTGVPGSRTADQFPDFPASRAPASGGGSRLSAERSYGMAQSQAGIPAALNQPRRLPGTGSAPTNSAPGTAV